MFSTFWYHESFLIFFFLFDRFGGTIQTDLPNRPPKYAKDPRTFCVR